jgi:hypothetical protein
MRYGATILGAGILITTTLFVGLNGWARWHSQSNSAKSGVALPGLVNLVNEDGSKTDFSRSETKLYIDTSKGYQEVDLNLPPFDQIDLPSFVALGGGYFKDKSHVYFDSTLDFSVVTSADSATFQAITDKSGKPQAYGKDSKKVFFGPDMIMGADPLTFHRDSSKSFYDADNKSVFFQGLSYNEQKVDGADPRIFIELTAPDGSPSIYGKQGTTIFCGTSVLVGADDNSFEVGSGGAWATDKQHSYEMCTVYDPDAP